MKILRDMAIINQGVSGFDYADFKDRLEKEHFMNGQHVPLKMRIEVLESFFEPGTVSAASHKKAKKSRLRDMWKFSKGALTIIDLSCPFVGPDDACAPFNICIALFLKDRDESGRVITLDEARKVRMMIRISCETLQN